MAVAGIIAEYNPFHRGHLRQVRELRRRCGEDTPVVAVMSGDFVQRGEAAVFSKYARAEAAVRCGVSLVLELPLPWCLSSAEGFARGGVGLLQALGIVDIISFGSESADAEGLCLLAETLDSEAFSGKLPPFLAEGLPFAEARTRAVEALVGKERADLLRSPNDLLGTEYIRAAKRLGFAADFRPIRREGSLHDGAGSASEIRARLLHGESAGDAVPPECAAILCRETEAGRGPVSEASLRAAILSRLRMLDREDFAALPDAGEGIENRLFEACREVLSPAAAAAAAKSRRYALSRLRRMVYCAALGIRSGAADGTPPYARILAADPVGCALLREMRRTCSVPIINKPADLPRENTHAREIFELGSRAHDLYVLGYASEQWQNGLQDWRQGPFIHE